jgi:hypothetical protein
MKTQAQGQKSLQECCTAGMRTLLQCATAPEGDQNAIRSNKTRKLLRNKSELTGAIPEPR